MEIILWCLVLFVTICLVKFAVVGASYNEETNLTGKVIIVTGANSGIGYEVALDVAKRGATVILACRNENRGWKAANDVKSTTSNQNVRFRQVDLASFDSIRRFVEIIIAEETEIYSLVNNAGLFWVPFRTTIDGIESNFGVNHLGHFLLTILLLPLLIKAKESRIVAVGSLMYAFGNLCLNDIDCVEKKYNFVQAYSDSKLANVLTTSELARRVKETSIRTYCADPGIVFTNIGGDSLFMSSFFYRYLMAPILWVLMKTSKEGAQTIIYCICSEQVRNHTGKMYSECEQVILPWSAALDTKTSRDLWNESIRLSKITKEELTMSRVLTDD